MTVRKTSNWPQEVSLTPTERNRINSGEDLFVSWDSGEVGLTHEQAKTLIHGNAYRKVHASKTFVEGVCDHESGLWQVYNLHSFPEKELDAKSAAELLNIPETHLHALRDLGIVKTYNTKPLQKKGFKFVETELRRVRTFLDQFNV